MTLQNVRCFVDGEEVGVVTLDVDLDLPEGCELVYEATSLFSASAELQTEIGPDEWARLGEHFVVSDEAGEL